MRILHFYRNALPETIGGIEQFIDQITQGTTALGVKNTVLSLSKQLSSRNSTKGYELYTAKRNFEIASNGFSWQAINMYKKLVSQADLIHYHFPWPFADLVHLIVSPQIPSIITYHSDIVRQKLLLKLYNPIKIRFLNSVDHIVATSPNYLQSSTVLQSFNYKTSVIPIGINRENYPSPNLDRVSFFKEQYGKRFFLFIGAFRYYKGLEFILEAAERINYPIVITGSGHLDHKLKVMAQQKKLKNIFFTGIISDENKCALLQACYGLIFPSQFRSEAFGISLLEAAMFSKPLISCEIGTGTSYVNIHNETGLVIPPSNSQALVNAMSWLWMHPQNAMQMGQKAKNRYELLFTAKKMSQSYFDLYSNVISNRKKRDLITGNQKN